MRGIRIALVTGLTFLAAAGAATAADCVSRISYDLDVALDPAGRTVSGREVIVWRNYGSDPVQSLPFHLYMNAFSNVDSTFFKGDPRGARGRRFSPEHAGACRLKSLVIDGMGDLMDRLVFIQPDDGNPADETVVNLSLPRPVAPDESITIRIEFETILPRLVARAGWMGNFFMVAQWYPKLGVLEPPGWRGARLTRWNAHQYHRHSEFYANFADYEVRLTVPSGYVVGAVGREISRMPAPDDKTLYVFREECVHDFAWAACPDFEVARDTFSGQDDVRPAEYAAWAELLGVDPADLWLPDVRLTVLMHRDHRDFTALTLRTLKDSIKYFGLWLGPYPYENITVVDPAPGASAAAGMEYPTLFTGGTHALAAWWPVSELHVESVIVHEYGHNYWQGMVASNEFEEPWLDEGLNTYSEATVNHLILNPTGHPLETVGLGGFLTSRIRYLRQRPLRDPVLRASWDFYPGQYGVNTYDRPALLLLTAENVMGRPQFFRTLRQYYRAYQFGHPTTADFVRHFQANGNDVVTTLLEEVIYRNGTVDFRADSLRASAADDEGRVTSRALVSCTGSVRVPVEVLFRFEDGTELREKWLPGERNWHEFEFVRPAALVAVVVDPEYCIALDDCFANNSVTGRPLTGPVDAWQGIAQFVMQILLQLATLVA
jgi:hypothetical protein